MQLGATAIALSTAGLAAAVACLFKLRARLLLAQAKHPSLSGHSRIAARIASLIPFYEYDETRFFRCDDAPAEIAAIRRAAFLRLSQLYQARFAQTAALTAQAAASISDLQFTGAYRVPFQFRRLAGRHLNAGAFVRSSRGVPLTDLDGNCSYDLAGSYGVNVFGYDFYKSCIERALARVGELGPVLGPYHPVVADNVRRLRAISGLDEVSFHMSGTEAVMQAVRLARYHTGRSHLVRFCGAYHGWWGDVQPGVGNPLPAHETYTLKDKSEATLRVLRTRADIACVLVNPVQALHSNANAPADSALLDSSRRAHFDRQAYAGWLRRLRTVCSERGIVLIFDEVFVGFRLAAGGAQEYFGVRADMVTFGKTLGGGLPVGAVCGRKDLMKRFRDDRPAEICFARGTFNSHPYVMAAMNEFLRRLDEPDIHAVYRDLDQVWDRRAERLNRLLAEQGLPVQVTNMSSIFTICYTRPARYNWMLQFYLRAQGLSLSWTGRLIFSLNYSEPDFDEVAARFVAAAGAMQRDGWWWAGSAITNKSIKRQILREMLLARARELGMLLRRHRIEELPAEQLERRPVVELDVMERVGEDLRHPHQAGLDVLDEEQMHGPEQEAAYAEDQPDLSHMRDELGGARMRLEQAEQGRIEIKR
jgi:glutamate-1-semialdehyde 2,1-aminomutase